MHVWTGTDTDGHLGFGNAGNHWSIAARPTRTLPGPISERPTDSDHLGGRGSTEAQRIRSPLYGISKELVVSPSAVPEPSSLWMAGIAISAGLAYGWSRHRRDQRRQRPVGPPDATE